MADVKESALTQKSDCKWVRALDANGNSIRISKEDLASVVEGLIGTVNLNKNGLMPKGQNVFVNSSGSMPANSYMYLCKVNTNPSYIDIFLTHTYRSPVRLSVTVAYEPGKTVCGKSFVIGTESLAELYYNIADDGCELYVKNLQSGPMVVTAFIYKGVFEAPMSIEGLPSSAIKF